MMSEHHKLLLEQMTFKVADKHIEGYNGGSWSFKPEGYWELKDDAVTLFAEGNGFYKEGVSAALASKCIGCLATNVLSWITHDRGQLLESEYWAEQYYRLRDSLLDNMNKSDAEVLIRFLD